MDRTLQIKADPHEAEPAEARRPTAAGRSATLKEIGRIVRQARAKRGMTRRTLAALSQTSERYLAQIESGGGNPTILVLEAVAHGLGLTLFDLLPAGDGVRGRLAQRLGRLTDAEAQAVMRLLETGEVDPADGARARRISLIGLRGAGKTTLGNALAARLDCPFIELDKLVERDHGADVAMLFEVYGQATFRRYEREALQKVVAAHDSAVIATAGGVVADQDNFALLRATTHAVWLKAAPAEHMQRVMEQGDFRPMAQNRQAMKDLIAILESRDAEYGRAHAQLETSGRSVAECVEALERIAGVLFAKT